MFSDILKSAFETIKAKKLRTLLSMIGIVIGVTTMALVSAMSSGLKQEIEDQFFKNLSVNSLYIFRDGQDSKLSTDDTEVIIKSPYVTSVTARMSESFMVSNSMNSTVKILNTIWVKDNYFASFFMELELGKYFDNGDSAEKVVVLWFSTIQELFEVEDPKQVIGETITIRSKKFRVIGVLEEIWDSYEDNSLYIPLWASKRYLLDWNSYSTLITLIDDVKNIQAAEEDITIRLRDEYNIRDWDLDGFVFDSPWSMIESANEITSVVSLVLLGISIFNLLVSGIGIMNVMFAGVAERTKEIGILKSIGATKKDIQSQFLIEAVLITFLSWLIWVILAELIITVALYFDAPISRSLWGDAMALGFACLTGILSGWYPAVRASNLDPVDALRS